MLSHEYKRGASRGSGFSYWIIPLIIFVFGVGMFLGRSLDLRLPERERGRKTLLVHRILDKLWPQRPSAVQDTLPIEKTKPQKARDLSVLDSKPLASQISDLKSRLEAREKEMIGLEDQVRTLTETNKELAAENASLAESNRALTESNKALEEAQKILASRRERLVQTKRELQSTQHALSRARERIDYLQDQASSYRVLRNTPLLRNPADNAQVISYLRAGRRVQVAQVVNDKWMKVQYSRTGNPPGYVRKDDVAPIR